MTVNGSIIFSGTSATQLFGTVGGTGTAAVNQVVFGASSTLKTANVIGVTGTTASINTTNLTLTKDNGTSYEFNGASQTISGITATVKNLTFSGTGSKTLSTVTSITGDFTLSGTASTTAVNAMAIGGNVTIGTGTTFAVESFTHTVGGNWTNNGTFTKSGSTINFNGATQSIGGTTAPNFFNLTFTGSGTKTLGGASTISGAFVIGSGVIADLGTFTSSANTLTVGGYPTTNGTWGGTTSSATHINTTYFAAKTGILNVTTATSGCVSGRWTGAENRVWNNPNNWCDLSVPTASTNVVIPSVTNLPEIGAAAVCNNLTINTSASLTITGTNALTISGNLSNSGSFTANSSTVILNGTAQTLSGNAITFNNLTVSNSGVKTLTAIPTISGTLSMEGTATVSAAPTYGGSATLQYNTATLRTTGVEWVTPFAGTGGVIIANTGVITVGTAAKVFNLSVPLTINSGASLNSGNFQLTFGGNFVNNGTFTAGSSPVVITNTATQIIGGFSTTGLVSMTKSSGTATLQGNVNGAGLTISGGGGTLHLGTGLAHTFSGDITLSAGTLNGGSSILSVNSTSSTAWNGTGTVFSAGTGTVNLGGAAQTLSATTTTFNNLTLSNSGVKTFTNANSVNGILSMEGTATATLTGALTYGSGATLQYKGSGAQITGSEFPASWSGSGGVKIENASGVTLGTPAKSIGANPLTIGGSVANSIFNDGGFQLTATGTLNLTSGTFKLGAGSSATTFPAFTTYNIASGTTVEYAASAAQTVKGISYSNLTISGSGVKSPDADITVNGILNLNSANGSATQGCLNLITTPGTYPGRTSTDYSSLVSKILYMGSSATTTGTGDVTGIVKRNFTIVANTPYTFGNQFTTVALTAGTMPTALSVIITIGNSPQGPGELDIIRDAVKRTYEIVPADGSGCTVTANFHYLTSELTSSINTGYTNTETKLTTMDYDIGGGYPSSDEHGRANYDFTNKYIGLSNIPISYFIQEWKTIFALRDYSAGYYVWNGSTGSDWNTAANWTLSPGGGSGVPNNTSHVIIPDVTNDPVLPTGTTTLNTISIQSGGRLNMGSNTLIIANSLSGGWEDLNPSGNDPGTSTVVFSMPGTTISGNAWFYDVQINSDATNIADITNQAGSTMKISGSITRTGLGTGKWYANVFDNTVEYNKSGDQNILVPDGSAYHNLTLTGSGTKTLLGAMSVGGNFTTSGTASATAGGALAIAGNVTLGSGTFTGGSYTHTVAGNWSNSGTFTATGTTVEFNGSGAATIGASNFNNITFSGEGTKTAGGVLTVAGNLTVSNNFTSGDYTHTVGGNWTNDGSFTAGSGTIAFNGPGTQTIIGANTFNNLTVSKAATGRGVSASSSQEVNGTLALGDFNHSSTAGALDMTSDRELIMGVNATTSGTADVSGIITRNSFALSTPYFFGNQYTTMNFTVGPLPTSVSVKVNLTASEPAWMTTTVGILRYYDVKATGRDAATRLSMNLHYLDSELNGATESNLDLFDDHVIAGGDVHDHGRSVLDNTNNYAGFGNVGLLFLSGDASFGQRYWTLGTSTTSGSSVWIGGSPSGANDWDLPGNWQGGVPTSTSAVTIPVVSNYPSITISTTNLSVGTLSIATGATLNITGNPILTIAGGAGAWNNSGTFNPGNGTVNFTGSSATMIGTTNFNNISVSSGDLTLSAGNYLGIVGALTLTGGTLNAADNSNTVEYNGSSAQTVINPNGGTGGGYYNLSLSGSGTVTMPGTDMNVHGNFTTSGSVSVPPTYKVNVTGNTTFTIASDFTLKATATSSDILSDTSPIILNGGTFKTDATVPNFTETVGTLQLTQNSTLALGAGVHTLTFADSHSLAWSSGKMLTITGWTCTGGLPDGAKSGTAGRIFVSGASTGLSSGQLDQIRFDIGSTYYPANILSTGEIVADVTGDWSGVISGAWDNPGNWKGGTLPSSTSDIVISSGTNFSPGLSSSVTYNSLTINTGAAMTIDGGALTISTNLSNSGSLTINSTALDNNGSLVVYGTSTGNVTYNRYLGSNYYLISAPVSGQSTSTIPVTAYVESTDLWNGIAPGTFANGSGYLRDQSSGTGTVAFTGTLNGDLPNAVTLARSTVGGYLSGWNLIGNPYTSAIGINNNYSATNSFLAVNSSKLHASYQAVYIWDDVSLSYKTISNTGFTAPGGEGALTQDYVQVAQAFFVKAAVNGNTITFNRSMQSSQPSIPLKSASTTNDSWPGVQLKVSTGAATHSTIVTYAKGMTSGLDPGYDIGLMSSGGAIELSTRLVADNGIDFTIQAVPDNNFDSNVVPVSVKYAQGGQVTFSAYLVPLSGGMKIYLEDRTAKVFTDLSTGSYTVTLPANTSGTGRFFIVAGNQTVTGVETINDPMNDVMVWYANGQINIKGSFGANANTYLYDMNGRLLNQARLSNVQLNQLVPPAKCSGVYLVQIIDSTKQIVRKVVIHNN